jgi:hypothetical protein
MLQMNKSIVSWLTYIYCCMQLNRCYIAAASITLLLMYLYVAPLYICDYVYYGIIVYILYYTISTNAVILYHLICYYGIYK